MKVNQNNLSNPRPQINHSLIEDLQHLSQREFLLKYPNKTEEDYQKRRKQVIAMIDLLFKKQT